MTKGVLRSLALASLLAVAQPALPATLTADGAACTLFDAIRAANTDSPSGGCVAGNGADVILLAADESITLAEAVAGSSNPAAFGGFAALPDVTTEITVRAAGGQVIERAPPGCGPADDFRLFNVRDPGELTLVGLTLRNGCIAPEGSVTAEGGAVHTLFGSLRLENTSLLANVTRGDDSGEPRGAANGGALYMGGGALEIAGGLFEGNVAQGGHRTAGTGFSAPALGGALYLSGLSGGVTITAARFVGNVASAGDAPSGTGAPAAAGALLVAASPISLLADTSFESNVARAGTGVVSGNEGEAVGAGAVAIYEGVHGTFERLTFRSNSAEGGDATEATGLAAGGALHIEIATIATLRNSTFSDNTAAGGDAPSPGDAAGGAIAVLASSISSVDSLTLERNRAVGGGSAATGGGLFVGAGASIASLVNSTFYGNEARSTNSEGAPAGSASGGGLATGAGAVVQRASHLTVVANAAVGGASPLTTGSASGGGLYAAAESSITIDNSVLADNARSGDDGAGTDCASAGGALISGGYNHEETADGSCAFAAPGDVTGSDPLLGPFGDHGCTAGRRLPDGTCAPTVALLPTSLPTDQGSCAVSAVTVDERGFPRPVDLPQVANAADGCDKGAFELQQADLLVDLHLTKEAQPTVPAPGELSSFELAVRNEDGALIATGVVVNDPVPAGTAFVGSDCGATLEGDVVRWAVGSLAPGAVATCTLTFQRTGGAAVQNTATVTAAQSDPDPTDNVAVAQVAGIAEVPALDRASAFVLLLVLAALAVWRLRL